MFIARSAYFGAYTQILLSNAVFFLFSSGGGGGLFISGPLKGGAYWRWGAWV